MQIFAHRGNSTHYPENTLAAFQSAAQLAVHGVEFDVHVTKDQQAVVIHDEQLERTTNGHGFVKDYTLAELQQLDAGSWFAPQFATETIPTLQQVLAVFQHSNILINIELKTDIFEYPGIERLVIQEVEQAQLTPHIIISSFNHETLLRVHQLAPHIQTAALFSSLVVNLEDYVAQLQVDAYHIFYGHTMRSIMQPILHSDATVRTYTVNDTATAQQLQQAGVHAIFTDDPQLFL